MLQSHILRHFAFPAHLQAVTMNGLSDPDTDAGLEFECISLEAPARVSSRSVFSRMYTSLGSRPSQYRVTVPSQPSARGSDSLEHAGALSQSGQQPLDNMAFTRGNKSDKPLSCEGGRPTSADTRSKIGYMQPEVCSEVSHGLTLY